MVTMSILTRHTVSGVISEVDEDIYNHDVLGQYLERVDEDAKPYLAEMHRPRVAVPDENEIAKEEYAAPKPSDIKNKDKD